VAGRDPERVARLPDSEGLKNRVLLQAGHWVNFGAPVEQMIRLGGGRPIMVGAGRTTSERDVGAALGEPAAAFVFVQSHHAAQQGPLPLDRCVEAAHAHGVPVIVDAAAEEDMRRYVSLGADLVAYSGGKAFAGPTAGFIAGRRDLIQACEAQQRGIARPMKTGKEQIIGLLAALALYEGLDATAEARRRTRVNTALTATLEGRDDVVVSLRPDEAGRPIERVAVSARDGAFDVRDLVRYLAAGEPSIRTRNHLLGEGIVLFDPREVSEEQAALIAARLESFFLTLIRPPAGPPTTVAATGQPSPRVRVS